MSKNKYQEAIARITVLDFDYKYKGVPGLDFNFDTVKTVLLIEYQTDQGVKKEKVSLGQYESVDIYQQFEQLED